MKFHALRVMSLAISSVVIISLYCYQLNANAVKSIFFKKSYAQKKHETQVEYFKKIGKSDLQIRYDRYTTIGVNILQVAPFVISVVTRNPIMYLTYATAIFCSTSIVGFGKKIVKEPRPDDSNDLTSFPSGHSVFAFMAAVSLFMCIKKKRNKFFGAFFILFASFVAIGRVLAMRHWVHDVVIGGLVGCFVGVVAFFLVKKINDRLRLFVIE